jgi:hypothetical protein
MSNFQNLPGLSHVIPLDQAAAMTKRYRDHRNEILKPEYANRDILAICETFNKIPVQHLVASDECVGLRIYYGMSEDLLCHAILVGVNSKGEDILPDTSSNFGGEGDGDGEDDGGEGGGTLEDSIRCPTVCPPDSPLNEP